MSRSILLIEDNAGERELFRLALAQAAPMVLLQAVSDGNTAWRILRGVDPDALVPSLVLLDLRLSGQDGHDFLRQLRTERRFASLPVVVFTTSEENADVVLSYANGANSYIIKPGTFSELVVIADLLCRYWLTCNHVVRAC